MNAPAVPLQKLDFNEREYAPPWAQLNLSDVRGLCRYPDRSQLEKKLADFYQLNAEQVLVTNGGDEAIELLIAQLSPINKALLPLPAFSQYIRPNKNLLTLRANDNLLIDINDVINALTPEISWVILTSPNNPTGQTFSEAELVRLLDVCKQQSVNLWLDEAYVEFSDADGALSLLQRYDNLILLRTFSKAYGLAGARIGYLLANEQLITAFRQRCMPFNVSSLSLALASQALEPTAQKEVSLFCQTIRRNRRRLQNALTSKGVTVLPSEGNFVLLRLEPLQCELLTRLLKLQGIEVRVFSASELRGCIRITVPLQVERLVKVLMRALSPDWIGLDIDNTLLDTSRSYDQCVIQTAEFFGVQLSLQQVQQKRLQGGLNNDWRLCQALLQDNQVEVTLAKIINAFQRFYHGDGRTPALKDQESSYLKPKLLSLLNQASARIAVITGRPKAEANCALEQLTLQPKMLITCDDVNADKPDPEGLNCVSKSFASINGWYLGDSVDDMQAATAAGLIAIGVGSNRDALLDAGAVMVIDTINQLQLLLPEQFFQPLSEGDSNEQPDQN